MSLTKFSRPGIITVFSARASLVSDIPAGYGKIANLFLQCSIFDVQYEEYVKGRMSDTTTGFGIELGKNREDFNHSHLMPSRKKNFVKKPNSWTYNFVEVPGHNQESS
jgi:hypothetical protein